MIIRGYPASWHIEAAIKTAIVIPILVARRGFMKIEDFGQWGSWKCTVMVRRIGYDAPPW